MKVAQVSLGDVLYQDVDRRRTVLIILLALSGPSVVLAFQTTSNVWVAPVLSGRLVLEDAARAEFLNWN